VGTLSSSGASAGRKVAATYCRASNSAFSRMIAGVCALARRFGMKPWQVRLLVVLSCRLPGPQVLLYVALWIILQVE
jgi:phage shock protein PspC (stress-responsive transcriptional regulator)